MTSLIEKVDFPAADGTSRLDARLDRPPGTPRAYALFAHCFTCSKETLAAARIADGLTRHGIAVLRFDFTGLGGSGGDFANTSFSANVADLIAAAAWLATAHRPPALLVGHSLGGAAVLAAAPRLAEVAAVCSIAAPADPAQVTAMIDGQLPAAGSDAAVPVTIAGRPFAIRRAFLDDLARQALDRAVAGLERPLLIVHSAADRVVPFAAGERLFAAARAPKSLIALDTADHLLSDRADAAHVADVIAAWADRYIARPAADRFPAVVAPAAAVRVGEAGTGTFVQRVSVGGRHRLTADEPIADGGTDTGPSPYDLLLAGLGACTAMTIRLYADRKGLPLERVVVTLRHAKIHAEDCAACETKTGMIDHIDREVALSGPLDAAMRARLLEIAGKCPVHRTLTGAVHVTTRLAG